MKLNGYLEWLNDALRSTRANEEPAVAECIVEVASAARDAEHIVEAVLREHYEHHEIVSPRFCTEACRLAESA